MKKQLKLRKITEIPLEPSKWPKPLRISKMTKIPLLLLLSILNHAYQIENNKFEILKTGPPSSHQNICNRLKTGYNYK